MYHDFPRTARFWDFLFEVDRDLAETARNQGCPYCGGRLHAANYSRDPRGGPDDLPSTYRLRFSFCCNRDACRKRVTPPSVRFLGRKLYLGVVVVLVAAMQQGPSPRRLRDLAALCEADPKTIRRWLTFWRELFPQTHFWKTARARLALVMDIAELPYALLEAFLGGGGDLVQGWGRLLRFLAPITIPGALKIEVAE
jgi:hypothetical protein